MGKSPVNSKTQSTKKQARIMSFNDARRATGRPSIPLDNEIGSKATRQLGDKAAVTKPLAQKESPKPRRKASVAKSAKAASPKARRTSNKSIRIERGQVREGALSLMSDEEIEQRAAAEKQEAKEARRKESRLVKFVESRKKRAEEKKRSRNKAKADKQFDAAYGGDSKATASAGEGGPRAAVYKAEMGSSQKKSAKMQMKNAAGALKGLGSKVSIPQIKLPEKVGKAWKAALGIGLVAVFAISLYGPAQQYYVQMRETDRLQAEYIAVSERSDFLQSSIDSLSSDEGIEDKAHTDLGYIKKNEQTASVKGLNLVDTTEFTSNVAPGSIPAPDTWYSAFLDPIFGYDH